MHDLMICEICGQTFKTKSNHDVCYSCYTKNKKSNDYAILNSINKTVKEIKNNRAARLAEIEKMRQDCLNRR